MKRSRRQMLLNYYSKEELKDFAKVPRKAVLQWLEEANRFLYKVDPNKWKLDDKRMKAIGW